jgi:hypothetical protein
VSDDWPDALRSAWAELAHHPARARQFRTKRLSPTLALGIYAGLRAMDDAPCLLIEAEVPATCLFEVGGMRLNSYAGEDGPLVALTLEDPSRADLFATVCADAVSSATEAPADETLSGFLARLEAWRRFLRERRAGLTPNETVGLLGELLVLERLQAAGVIDLACWTAPDDALHDFLLHGHALEVKASLGSVSQIHISKLDQLDATGLRHLDLIHLRLVETPDGRSLSDVIANIERTLPTERSRREFENAILRRGLTPDDLAARSVPRVDTRSFSAFAVTTDFPRLTRTTVPAAVHDAQYSLELRAIGAYAVDFNDVVSRFSRGGI